MQLKMEIALQIYLLTFIYSASCTIDGVNFMNEPNIKPNTGLPGQNPCNPLYWFPRNVPEWCARTPKPPMPVPVPIPVPVPSGIPIPPMPPMPPNIQMPVPMPPFHMPGVYPVPTPLLNVPQFPPPPSSPYIMSSLTSPLAPHGMGIPVPPPYPGPYRPPMAGMVPGLPPIVTKDVGINIMPFSDAYSDLLEKHKNRMLRKEIRKLLEQFKTSRRRSSRRHHKYRFDSDEE